MTSDSVPAFGDLLRRARRAAGLTQEELAEQSGVSARAISDLERDGTRLPRKDTLELLIAALELSPAERARWMALRRQGTARAKPISSLGPGRQVLPIPPTDLLGREVELQAIVARLRRADVRLVTLTGPGGIGKTRLALAVVGETLLDYPDGAQFVALGALQDSSLVASAIAAALEVQEFGSQSPQDALIAHLRSKRLLMVLDNFEQVLDAAPLVAELLAACPQLKVLATSRAVLRLQAEHEFLVPPLALPERLDAPAAVHAASPAVALFVARAQVVRADFALTDANAPAVAEVCRRLDGLPLAIELAAARVKLLPPQELLERLEKRLMVVTGGARDLPARQRTLRDTVAWSYDLLSAEDQRLFRHLAVFAGGWNLETADAVARDELGLDVLDGLSTLLDHHLVYQQEQADGSARFRMLETIREYALERLGEDDQADDIHRRHAACYLQLVEQAEPRLRSREQSAWLTRLDAEHDNLRAALAWSVTSPHGAETGLRLAGALYWFWYLRGHLREGRQWLTDLLALPAATSRRAARMQALVGLGVLTSSQDDYVTARACLEESVAIGHELNDKRSLAYGLQFLAMTMLPLGDYAAMRTLAEQSVSLGQQVEDVWIRARALCTLGTAIDLLGGNRSQAHSYLEESIALFRQIGDRWGVARASNALGELARAEGDLRQAQALYGESLSLFRELGHRNMVALVRHNLGHAAARQGDLRQAVECFAESLALHTEYDDYQGIAASLVGVAGAAGRLGELELAARLFGAAKELFASGGIVLEPVDRQEYENNLAAVREQLTEDVFQAACQAGQRMMREQSGGPATPACQPLVLIAVFRFLGQLEGKAGRFKQAEQHLMFALEIAETGGARLERALTLLTLAELRATEQRHQEAMTLLEEVRAICEPLKATSTLGRVDALTVTLTSST